MVLSGVVKLASDPLVEPHDNTTRARLKGVFEEFRKSQGGTKKRNHVFNFESYGSAASFLKERARKNDLLYVEAIPRQHRWEGEDGTKKSRVVFRLTSFRILNPQGENVDN